MIGVAAKLDDWGVVEEFFELFKTPWERASPTKKYEVVLSAGEAIDKLQALSFVVYGSAALAIDSLAGVALAQTNGPADIEWIEGSFPIYGRTATFAAGRGMLFRDGQPVDCRYRDGYIRRIGYDLFGEVHYLLTEGQPIQRSMCPTVDLHIAVLRRVLRDQGVSFIEIPPRPAGHDFVCCLTHDIDFFGIRRHALDRTLVGFSTRATAGTLVDLVRGRRTVIEAIRNWATVLRLPLVFFRLARDVWRPFDDYSAADGSRPSTYFLVPFRDKPGAGLDGSHRPTRAVRYQISDIRDEATAVAARGNELAVHGIDAWCDVDAGRAELKELTSITGLSSAGVRMHWLYSDAGAAERLEQAGFDYDSTCGYNDAVGFRSGTSQVFRAPGAKSLMELPMAIMDTALFFPDRMGLPPEEGLELCKRVVAQIRRFGGTVVVNWHDRSLAPERLWIRPYRALLAYMRETSRVWFATGAQAVAWFRWRRAIRFVAGADPGHLAVIAPAPMPGLPGGRVAVHRAAVGDVVEMPLPGGATVAVGL